MYHIQEKEIKTLLRQGKSKQQIFSTLVTESNGEQLSHMLNNLPLDAKRKKTYFITLFIIALLLLLTIKQFLFVYLHENSSVSLMLGMIGPLIHIYIIRELLRSHRLAYQILPILSILALFRPESRLIPDMYMYICMAVLSGALYFHLYPKEDKIEPPAH
jgi:hypothetical protein